MAKKKTSVFQCALGWDIKIQVKFLSISCSETIVRYSGSVFPSILLIQLLEPAICLMRKSAAFVWLSIEIGLERDFFNALQSQKGIFWIIKWYALGALLESKGICFIKKIERILLKITTELHFFHSSINRQAYKDYDEALNKTKVHKQIRLFVF